MRFLIALVLVVWMLNNINCLYVIPSQWNLLSIYSSSSSCNSAVSSEIQGILGGELRRQSRLPRTVSNFASRSWAQNMADVLSDTFSLNNILTVRKTFIRYIYIIETICRPTIGTLIDFNLRISPNSVLWHSNKIVRSFNCQPHHTDLPKIWS